MASSSSEIPSSDSQEADVEEQWIPEGFEEVGLKNGTIYLVPDFMVETLQQAYMAKRKKEELRAFEASGSVGTFNFWIDYIPCQGNAMTDRNNTGMISTGIFVTGMTRTGMFRSGKLSTGMLSTGMLSTGMFSTGMFGTGFLLPTYTYYNFFSSLMKITAMNSIQ
jgi:hypothetical protein